MIMDDTIAFAKEKNPLWPFAVTVVDEKGDVVCRTTDCAHLSPLYHAEALAMHLLIQHSKKRVFKELYLYSTAEPDVLAQGAIHWSIICHDMPVKSITYGLPQTKVEAIWPFGIDITARELIERSCVDIELKGPVHEEPCHALFKDAKKRQDEIGKQHPARGVLSNCVEDFYIVTESGNEVFSFV